MYVWGYDVFVCKVAFQILLPKIDITTHHNLVMYSTEPTYFGEGSCIRGSGICFLEDELGGLQLLRLRSHVQFNIAKLNKRNQI